LKCTDRIALPEVNARTEPIIGIFFDQKLRTAQNNPGDLDAVTMKA
jgi:hypothetical protein